MLDVSILEQKLFLKNAIEFMSAKFYLSLYYCNICNTNPYGTVCGHVVKYEYMEPKNTQILVELTTDLYVHYISICTHGNLEQWRLLWYLFS